MPNSACTSGPCQPKNHHTCHGWKIAAEANASTLWPPCTAAPEAARVSGTRNAAAIAPASARHRNLRPGGSASSTGPIASTAHSLFAIASPSSTPAHSERSRPAEDRPASRTAATHRAPPSSSSGWPCSSALSAIGLAVHRPIVIARASIVPPAARLRAASHTPKHRGGHQARQRDHPVDGQRAAAPQAGQQRERGALDQRSAVGGGELQEFAQVSVDERVERRARLRFVVVPGEAVEAQPRHRGAAGRRCGRAQGILAEDLPHRLPSARRTARLERAALQREYVRVAKRATTAARPPNAHLREVLPAMPSLLDLTSQGDVGTISDESKLSSITLMTPQQLYELWERQSWQSHTIDLSRDQRDWQAMGADLREKMAWNLSSFFIGEERVTTQFSGLVMAYESQSEEAFLTTQQVDEARHAQHFNRFYEQVHRDRRHVRGSPAASARGPQPGVHRDVRRGARRLGPAPDREPARHRGEGRLRDALPHDHRGHARAHRPVVPDRLHGATRDPARLGRRLQADLPGRAPPRRLRHVVPA